MNDGIVAVIFQWGGKLLTEYLRNRPRQIKPPPTEVRLSENQPPTLGNLNSRYEVSTKATSVEAGCVPCAIGHYGTCSGVLNEATRFAKKDGIDSGEVIDRINICLDELNAMERVDLRPEKIASLPHWEKELAHKALNESRAARHALEGISSTDQLETITANLQTARNDIGRQYFKKKLSNMPAADKSELVSQTIQKLEEEG